MFRVKSLLTKSLTFFSDQIPKTPKTPKTRRTLKIPSTPSSVEALGCSQPSPPLSPYVTTKYTPNPYCRRYLPREHKVITDWDFQGINTIDLTPSQAHLSPLAQVLFAIPQICHIMLSDRYIAVTINYQSTWTAQLSLRIKQTISTHFRLKHIVAHTQPVRLINQEDTQQEVLIKRVMFQEVRSKAVKHGGDIRFVRVDQEDQRLVVRLCGACKGCPFNNRLITQLEEVMEEEQAGIDVVETDDGDGMTQYM